MKVPADIFREYDIRGIVDTELTAELARHLGCAVGTFVRRGGGKRVVVGTDCRESGVWLADALIEQQSVLRTPPPAPRKQKRKRLEAVATDHSPADVPEEIQVADKKARIAEEERLPCIH